MHSQTIASHLSEATLLHALKISPIQTVKQSLKVAGATVDVIAIQSKVNLTVHIAVQ